MASKKFSELNNITGPGNQARTKLRRDYVRCELFKNIFNETRAQSIKNHNATSNEPIKSEYSDQFYRLKCDRFDAAEEYNINKYQLYASDAITFWTSKNFGGNFKQWHPMTKPDREYFGGQWR